MSITLSILYLLMGVLQADLSSLIGILFFAFMLAPLFSILYRAVLGLKKKPLEKSFVDNTTNDLIHTIQSRGKWYKNAKVITAFIFAIIMIGGATLPFIFLQTQSNKENVTHETQSNLPDDISLKTKECQDLKVEAEKILEERANAESVKHTYIHTYIEDLFYSPKRKDCIVQINNFIRADEPQPLFLNGTEYTDVKLVTYSTDEVLFATNSNDANFTERKQELEVMKEDLKKF